jgi:hypothetical protein
LLRQNQAEKSQDVFILQLQAIGESKLYDQQPAQLARTQPTVE